MAAAGLDGVHHERGVFAAAEGGKFYDARGAGFFGGAADDRARGVVAGCAAGFAHVFDGDGDVVQGGGGAEDAFGFDGHPGADRRGLAANFEFEDGAVGDDVATGAAFEQADVDARGAGAVARDGVELNRSGGGGEEGVAAEVGIDASVCGDAAEGGVELGGGEDVIGAASDGAGLRERDAEVRGEVVIDVAEHAGGDHGFGATAAFFGGLKDELDFAAAVFQERGQNAGEPEPDGGVAVVPAGVHATGARGGEVFARGQVGGLGAFVDGQGVEIDAEGDRGAGAPGVVGADDTREAVA